jgi:hypothetical protein
MKLPRPYIPWHVREQVIDQQMITAQFTPTKAARYTGSAERRVRWKLEEFFAGIPVELHHSPALVNRKLKWRFVGKGYGTVPVYDPPANDPNYLVYMPVDEHDIRTRVRGARGQYSDLALVRKRKRQERKAKRRRFKWPKRKFPQRRVK